MCLFCCFALTKKTTCALFYSMAFPSTALGAFILAIVLAHITCSTCHLLKGSVSCFDCDSHNDLSGITVAIKCKHHMTQVTTLTGDNGCFEARIRPNISPNCFAKVLGGPRQFCSYKQFMISRSIKEKGLGHNYTFPTPLILFSSCPSLKSAHAKGKKAKKEAELRSSKTVDLPLPKEWGLAPSTYYVPFFPIIGIP